MTNYGTPWFGCGLGTVLLLECSVYSMQRQFVWSMVAYSQYYQLQKVLVFDQPSLHSSRLLEKHEKEERTFFDVMKRGPQWLQTQQKRRTLKGVVMVNLYLCKEYNCSKRAASNETLIKRQSTGSRGRLCALIDL